MPSRDRDAIQLPYGRAKLAPDDVAGPAARLVPGRALRLSDGPYPFAEPPDLIGCATLAARLDLLREHLQSLCDVWDQPSQLFLDAYFGWVALALEGAADELAQAAARLGGLFHAADWSFAALRPLPQAHLAPDGGTPVRVEFAFWTGAGFVAVTLEGASRPRRQRRDELARLAAGGIALVAVPGLDLKREGAALLARLLPAPLQHFWRDVPLPMSPFHNLGGAGLL